MFEKTKRKIKKHLLKKIAPEMPTTQPYEIIQNYEIKKIKAEQNVKLTDSYIPDGYIKKEIAYLLMKEIEKYIEYYQNDEFDGMNRKIQGCIRICIKQEEI